ncbi:COX15/CtaA family protein [Paenibacillus terrae]|uniref:Cytochrome Caa3 oxidase n=1 Tax=Paenibacillus terrae TaxID=159743 RepID=A0A0D7X5M4_9BACL|nr:COX15/CtaA family protein [Paenibacillus terrae]KJD46293.1 cytochrome Caa3 oxidase [Paenibacillus terrae]
MNSLNNKIRILKWLALVTCIVMFLATFGGGVVTRTDSGLGCGREFPLCNGKLVPAHTIASVIEFTHRSVSAMAGILSIASFVGFLLFMKHRKDLQLFSLLTLMFVIIQGAMGALAVIFSQSAAVMGLHFGFALIAFASATMMTLGAWQEHADSRYTPRLIPGPVSRGFRNFIWLSTIYTYIAVYSGALLSHSVIQKVVNIGGFISPLLLHQISAGLLFVIILAVGHYSYRYHPNHRDIRILGVVSVLLILLQVVIGIILLYVNRPEIYMFIVLGHMLVIASLFSILAYLSYRVWQLSPDRNIVRTHTQRT